MEIYNQLFLQALKAALKGEKVQWDEAISHEDWLKLMNLAQMHNVLAMIYEAVYSCPAAKGIDPQLNNTYKKRMVYQVTHQTMKTQEFLALVQFLREEGLTPVVVKGIVCRNLQTSHHSVAGRPPCRGRYTPYYITRARGVRWIDQYLPEF